MANGKGDSRSERIRAQMADNASRPNTKPIANIPQGDESAVTPEVHTKPLANPAADSVASPGVNPRPLVDGDATVYDVPQGGFDYGYGPAQPPPTLEDELAGGLVETDGDIDALHSDIEGSLSRPLSEVEVTTYAMLQPINAGLSECVGECAEATLELQNAIEDELYNELGATGEEVALTISEIMGSAGIPQETQRHIVDTTLLGDANSPTPSGGGCQSSYAERQPPDMTVTLTGDNGTILELEGVLGPFIVIDSDSRAFRVPYLATGLRNLYLSLERPIGYSSPQRGSLLSDTGGMLFPLPGDRFIPADTAYVVCNGSQTVPERFAAMMPQATVDPPYWVQRTPECDGCGRSPEIPPQTAPPAPAPPPPAGPTSPPAPTPSCIPICPPASEPTEDDAACLMWFDRDACILAALPKGTEPEGDNWIQVGNELPASALRRFVDACTDDDDESETESTEIEDGVASNCSALPNALFQFLPVAFGKSPLSYTLGEETVDLDLPLALADPLGGAVTAVVEWFFGKLTATIDTVEDVQVKAFEAMGCSSPTHVNLRATASLIGFAERWLGPGFADALVPILQQARFVCPGSVPTAQEATAAYLANQIDGQTWRCWVRANNYIDTDYERVASAARTKLRESELISLRARGHINDAEFSRRVRELGYLDGNEPSELWELSKQLPAVQDIIRFMVRDADDPNIVQRFNLDDQFQAKFGGQLREWAENQRIPEKVMQYVWRSHWQIPSPTQLFEMLRRLSRLPQGDPGHVSESDIRTALVQQDIAPFWVDKYIALAYRPLTRVDARRLLERGIISEEQAVEAWQDLGYTQEKATNLVSLADSIARVRASKHPGIKRYAKGEINRVQLEQLLELDGIGRKYLPTALQKANIETNAARQKQCVAAIRKRYLMGELTDSQLITELAGQTLDIEQVEQLSEAFGCERSARGKRASGSVLCRWYEEGLISKLDFFTRLSNLGWDSDDATRFIRHCEIRIERKLAAEERKKIAEMIKNTKAEEKEREKQAKELETAARKELAATDKLATRQKQRRKLKADIASAMSAKLNEEIADATRHVNAVFRSLADMRVATQDETLQLMKEAAESPSVEGYESLSTVTLGLINARIFPSPYPLNGSAS